MVDLLVHKEVGGRKKYQQKPRKEDKSFQKQMAHSSPWQYKTLSEIDAQEEASATCIVPPAAATALTRKTLLALLLAQTFLNSVCITGRSDDSRWSKKKISWKSYSPLAGKDGEKRGTAQKSEGQTLLKPCSSQTSEQWELACHCREITPPFSGLNLGFETPPQDGSLPPRPPYLQVSFSPMPIRILIKWPTVAGGKDEPLFGKES